MVSLEIRKLSKKYPNASDYTIKGLDLSVEKGEFLTLLGKSGCGKTTLLRIISGFEAHDEGEILLNGNVISSGSIWVPPERRNISIVFQDYVLFPNMTAWANIAFAIKNEEEYVKRINEMLKLMEIYDIKDKYPHQLSGGQQQRVAIARALIRQPDILLLDEPFSNLDTEIRETVRQEIQQILRKIGTTVVLVTHDKVEALSISQRVAILQEGRIEQVATPYEIYNKPTNMFVAEFIGKTNFLDGIVESGSLIRCEFGVIQPKHQIPYAKGTPVKILVRPENIIINEEGKITGTIQDFNYVGTHYNVMISVDCSINKKLMLHGILPGRVKVRLNKEIRFDIYIQGKYHVFPYQ